MNESTESSKHNLIIRIEMTKPDLMIRIAIPLETDCARARTVRTPGARAPEMKINSKLKTRNHPETVQEDTRGLTG